MSDRRTSKGLTTTTSHAGARQPPFDEAAERAVIAAIFFDNAAMDRVADILAPESFYRGAHKTIFGALVTLHSRREALDVVTAIDHLKALGELEQIGGAKTILEVSQAAASAENVTYHANIVARYAQLRSVIGATQAIAEEAYSRPPDVDEFIQRIEADFFAVTQRRGREGFAGVDVLVRDGFKRLEELYKGSGSVTGLATGYVDFDNLTAGFFPANLIILAARPGMGKTSLALNIAANVAARAADPAEQKAVAIFSVEMSKDELTMRLVASEAHLGLHDLRTPRKLHDDDWTRLARACGRVAESQIVIDDSAELNVFECRSKARRIRAELGRLDLVVVDYIQLMRGTGTHKERYLEVGEISRSLKALSKELACPVLALSQLRREAEDRADQKPQLRDLRESGSLEQDADMVLFVHRPGYYRREDQSLRNKTDLIIGKNRNGPTGEVELVFLAEQTRFANLNKEGYQSAA